MRRRNKKSGFEEMRISSENRKTSLSESDVLGNLIQKDTLEETISSGFVFLQEMTIYLGNEIDVITEGKGILAGAYHMALNSLNGAEITMVPSVEMCWDALFHFVEKCISEGYTVPDHIKKVVRKQYRENLDLLKLPIRIK